MPKKIFTSIFILLSVIINANAISAGVPVQLADKWELKPLDSKKSNTEIYFHNMPDNDILIFRTNGKKRETIGFFSGRIYKNPEEAFGVAPGGIHPDPILGNNAQLPNGKVVTGGYEDQCCRGFNNTIIIYDNNNKEILKKIILLKLDIPILSKDIVCEGVKEKGFYQKIKVFSPNKKIALPDGTFLLSDHETGTVIRFDDNLRSKSNMIGKSIFIVDPAYINNIVKSYYRPSPKYGVDWQKIFDDLYIKIQKDY